MLMHKLNEHDVEYAASSVENELILLVRKGLVRRVYGLLFLQMCLTGGVVAAATTTPAVQQLFMTPVFYISCSVASIAAVCATPCLAHKWPWNMVLLFGATLALSVPVAAAASVAPPKCVLVALGATAIAFGAAGSFVACFPMRMPGACGEWLLLATFASIPVALVQIWIPIQGIVWAWAGIVLFLAWIVYDLNTLHTHASVDDAVTMALHLYLDVINLFLCILNITGGSNQD